MCSLDRLKPIKLRGVWDTEDQHFTPWLAKGENLALLGETLGMELELEGQEINVGTFRADILCRNTEDDSRVLIENQLEATNHTHLGQILTYAAGLNAHTVVWIAREFREEHLAALDRLNEITDERFQYFGIEIKVWQIGNSARAPQFNIVSKPNDWSRTVSRSRPDCETEKVYEKFWIEFRKHLHKESSPINIGEARDRPFVFIPGIDLPGFRLKVTLSKQRKKISVRLVMLGSDAEAYFHLLQEKTEDLEKELKGEGSLEWRVLKRSYQVALSKRDTDPMNEADWSRQHKWLASKLELFNKDFREWLQKLDPADWEPPEDEDDE